MTFLKKKLFIFILVTAVVSIVAFAILPVKRSGAILPFGGQITAVRFCGCSANVRITVGPPVGGVFIYQPGATVLYEYGQILRSGPWVLGNWSPGGACLIPSGKGCATLPSQGTMIQVGTSL